MAAKRSTNDDAVGPAPTIATSAGRCSGRDCSLSVAELSGGGQPEVASQGGGLVLGAQHAALLEQRDDGVDEVVEAGRGEVRGEHEAVGAVGLDEVVDRVGDLRRGADERERVRTSR